MVEPWNDASILPPPVNTYKSDGRVDIQQLAHTCNALIKFLSKQSPLHREAAICARFLYKFDKKFRNDIGYRSLRKVNTALRKYLTLHLLKDFENFISLLPSQDDEQYLPTRQMLEYVLLRLLAFSKIMLRICVCSKQAAVFYLDRLKRGESHWMSLMPYALLSRIWSISMVLLQRSHAWYSNLNPFLEQLKLKGMNFLPADYSLPSDLEEWLDLKNLDNFGKFEWSQKKQVKFDQLLSVDDEGDTLDNILEFVDKINEAIPEVEETDVEFDEMKPQSTEVQVKNVSIDQGEKISRDIFKSFFKTDTVAEIKHSANRVTNKQSLNQFINNEEKFRNENSSHALTGHLSFMQWQSLKNSLLSLHDSLAKNRKIEKKFQKIWKEKCLDYK
ncbi:hypothetical protein NE865_08520 [Phthorimaea operculella]|nr:hypothetical protein NE865_08520 [Phthorimaea operculella]